jgi:hypothetical protein
MSVLITMWRDSAGGQGATRNDTAGVNAPAASPP